MSDDYGREMAIGLMLLGLIVAGIAGVYPLRATPVPANKVAPMSSFGEPSLPVVSCLSRAYSTSCKAGSDEAVLRHTP